MKCGLAGRLRSLEMVALDRSHTSGILYRFRIKEFIGRKRQFFIPLVFNLHDHLEPLDFTQNLIETGQVHKQLGGAQILRKSSTLWV